MSASDVKSARIQLALWLVSLLVSGITALVSISTRAAMAETKIQILQEMNQSFVRRPEFNDVRERFNSHCDQSVAR